MGSPIIFFGNAAKLLKSKLVLPGSTSGLLSVSPDPVTTSYDLVMPASQGASNTTLLNDGSGNLSWGSSGATSSARTINAQTGTTYTFALTDGSGNGNNPLVTLSNASPVLVTVPPNGTVAFPIGSQIDVLQLGAGQVSFQPGAGVTINSPFGNLAIQTQYAEVSLVKIATNTWDLFGTLTNGYIQATGGSVSIDGNYKIHTFTSSGTFTVLTGTAQTVEYLLVAGGGGGAGDASGTSGGGGAGGLLTAAGYAVTPQAYSITVGAGGAGGTNNAGVNGSDSIFDGITATGGGAGASAAAGGNNGKNGGSGGGACSKSLIGGTGVGGQGFAGGAGATDNATYDSGGGGGGAGAVGVNAAPNVGGNGGAGLSSAITGVSVNYAGGGGGSTLAGTPGSGGIGGGGNATTAGGGTGLAGTANTGGGGGAGGGGTGGAGGSGVVIIRYQFQ